MEVIDTHSVYKRRDDIRFRLVDGEAVVIRQKVGEVLVLNELGGRILTLADGVTPVGAWVETLLDEYQVERGALERDVLAFTSELAESELLEPVGVG